VWQQRAYDWQGTGTGRQDPQIPIIWIPRCTCIFLPNHLDSHPLLASRLLLLMTMIYLSGFLIIGWLIFILSVVPFFFF
jgi:hypothetical protein